MDAVKKSPRLPSILKLLFILSLSVGFENFARANVFEACPSGNSKALPKFDRVILVPGAGAQKTDLYVGPIHWKEYFSEYIPFLTKANIPFTLHAVSDKGDEDILTRYNSLLAQVKASQARGEKVLLLGHSMGGLVSRLLLRDHSIWNTVAGVLTISTPHRGTELVDAIIKTDSNTPWVSLLSKLVGFDIKQKEYLEQLTHQYANDYFNTLSDHNPFAPPVYSIVASDTISGLYQGIPLLGIGGQWMDYYMGNLSPIERLRFGQWGTQSDGVVPAYSQVWGNCIGWFHGSHAKVLGKVLLPGAKAEFREFMMQLTATLKANTLTEYEKSDLVNVDARSLTPSGL